VGFVCIWRSFLRVMLNQYCLNELFDMMQSPEKVIPVFFQDVEPGHLRCIESGPFVDAFKKHLEKK